jgi:hypothetical protein
MNAPVLWKGTGAKTKEINLLSDTQTTSVTTDVAMLDSLDPGAREVAVTSMLDQARQWLERAKESTVPAKDVAEFKAFVATVAEAAKQKKLSEEIQLDAVEMVRRSERALGIAIREGQAAREISSRQNLGNQPRSDYMRNGVVVHVGDVPEKKTSSPNDFIPHPQERVDIYAVTDNVTEEEFEVGLSIAKEEGNLSRANVVRKVTEIASFKEKQQDRWEQVEEFASRGFTSTQIAKTVGLSEGHLRKLAADRGVTFPADKITGVRRIDPLMVLEKTVASVEASGSALDLVTYEDVTPELAAELLERLKPGIKAIHQLVKQLKEIK